MEHGNVCNQSKRECDSLRDALQFPVRRRSRAESDDCNSRLLQDRLSDGCYHPGTGRCPKSIANPNSYTYSDSYSDGDGDVNASANANSDTYSDTNLHTASKSDADAELNAVDTYANTYGYCYCYCYSDSNCLAHRVSHGDFNSTAYSHAAAGPTSKGTPNTASATVRNRRPPRRTPYNIRTVAGVADPGHEARSRTTDWPRSAPKAFGAATAQQTLVRSVVLGQKTEFLHNLLPIFMQYVSEQFQTAPRDSGQDTTRGRSRKTS
jgi:hypothetical protein